MNYVIALCVFGLACAVDPICKLKRDSGLCDAFIPSYYYDDEFGACLEFIYGGCGGNENRFKTENECMERCGVEHTNVAICHLEKEQGMCLAYMPRYYYNAKEGKCEKFIYGGCQGNPNNFKTQEECEDMCLPQSSNVPVCEQEAETGLCRGYFPRYHYDKDTGKCSLFVYGGCGGNQNNFETEEKCLQACAARSSVPVCEQDPEPGICLAYMPSYYYDKTSGQCKRFIYGGCGGNDNRFKTKEECEDTCHVTRTEPVCEMDADTGMCRGYFPRYYFNKDSGECEKFVYGGCQGNPNNFGTIEECEQFCKEY